MKITFIHPWYFFFLLSIPLMIYLHLYAIKFSKKRAMKFANFEAIKRADLGIKGGQIFTRNNLLFSLRMIILFFLIIAGSGMIFWYEGQGVNLDYVLAIDASGSMLATDFQPTRLDAAKLAAIDFINSMKKHSGIGIVSFGGTAFIHKKIDTEHEAAKTAIDNMGLAQSGGTAIGDAIINSVNMFQEEGKSKVVILLSDGQSTVGTPVENAIQYAVDNFVTVHTVGIATTEGATFHGIQAISKLDEETLNSISQETGGEFYSVATSKELSQVYQQIANASSEMVPVPLTVPSIIIAFIILVIEWLLISLRYRILP